MRQSISISLPDETKEELDEYTESRGASRSEVVREAIQEYLSVHRFRELRRKLIPHAEEQGLYTDEDVFREIS